MSLPLIKFFSSVHKLTTINESKLPMILEFTEHVTLAMETFIYETFNDNVGYLTKFSIEADQEIVNMCSSFVSTEKTLNSSSVDENLIHQIVDFYGSWMYEFYEDQEIYSDLTGILEHTTLVASKINETMKETITFLPHAFYSSSELALFNKLKPINLKTFIEITTQKLMDNFSTDVMLSILNIFKLKKVDEFHQEELNFLVYKTMFPRSQEILQTLDEEKMKLLFYYSDFCKKKELIKQTLRNK